MSSADHLDDAGNTVSELSEYHGLKLVRSNARLQQRTELRDVLGRTERVLDALQHASGYGYDPFGNLVSASDPNGNVVRMRYDALGRKLELNDPDLGATQYEVDPLGQTWRQSSPEQRKAGQVVTFGYDLLGRLTARLEPSLSSHWSYDTAKQGIGRLAEAYTGTAQDKRYQRLHEYDELGRLRTTRERRADADYVSTLGYDSWGRLVSRSDQRGADPASLKRFGLRYNGYGYLARLERGELLLWRADAQDAARRTTQQTLGNGLLQTRDYSPYTGRLRNAMLKTPAQQQRLVEGYQYDILGNVSTRTQGWNGVRFEENFSYDDLNRLRSSQLVSLGQAEQVYGYDDAGNLNAKPGQGAYDYGKQGDGAQRPHAVHSIGGQAFVYDDNGNLKQGGGRSISWTSFDMPDTLVKGMASSSFTYGPEHQRTRQTRRDGKGKGESTVTYAGAQEAEQAADGTLTVKTYWPLGVGVEIDRGGAASEFNWTHSDRLGSVVAITGAGGELKESLGYDAWGKRRTADASASGDAGVVDDKGYTGHEMLDQLDLVHMNGRVYDPATARFLSADPFVQDPTNGQGYNRYSYVLNNPTNLTDPTGFLTQVIISGAEELARLREQERILAQLYNNLRDAQRLDVRARADAKNMGKISFRTAASRAAVGVALFFVNENGAQDGCHSGDLCAADPATGELTHAAYVQKLIDAAVAQAQGDQGKDASTAVSNDAGDEKKGKKRGPSTNPDAPHNKKIREEAAKELAANPGSRIVAGGGVEPEVVVKTPGGIKESRRPDIIIRYADGSLHGINVGRTMADGSPVPREVDARRDLNEKSNVPTRFVPYDR